MIPWPTRCILSAALRWAVTRIAPASWVLTSFSASPTPRASARWSTPPGLTVARSAPPMTAASSRCSAPRARWRCVSPPRRRPPPSPRSLPRTCCRCWATAVAVSSARKRTAFAQISTAHLLPLLVNFVPETPVAEDGDRLRWRQEWTQVARFTEATADDPLAVQPQPDFGEDEFFGASVDSLDILWDRLKR